MKRLIDRIRIDWRTFAVTRGGFFEWGRPSEYDEWPNGRPLEPAPMLVSSGGFCAPSTAYYTESGWQQWAEWYCLHRWSLAASLPPLSVVRGAVRYA